MIRKLRIKFIAINMALVSLVLMIVFAAICSTNYLTLKSQSMEAMVHALQRPDMAPAKLDIGMRKPQKFQPMLPVFCLISDDSGNIIKIFAENAKVSQETAEAALTQALKSSADTGTIPSLNLRFLKEKTLDGLKIAFVDTSNEQNSMMRLIVTSALIGFGGLAAFFLISLYLSGWALRPADKAWEQQRRFIADASHELKTPLTVILTNTDILMSHRNDTVDSQYKWVEYIRAEAGRMKELINDLLFLAKSDASHRDLKAVDEINLSDLAWSGMLTFESVAYEHKIRIDLNIAPNITMYADEGQMRQLIAILADNACKYAGEGGCVTLTLEKYQDKIHLSVNNTGPTIPQDNLKHVFERFYRADQSRSREAGGYGLGLSIAKSIVDNHKGKIWAESTETAGTTFYIILPVK